MELRTRRFWVGLSTFAVLALVVPLFYFMIADAALMPLGGVLMLMVFHLIETPAVALLELVHLGVYGPLLFFIVWRFSRYICPDLDEVRVGRLVVILGLILLLGFLPVLGAGHGVYEDLSAYEFYPTMYQKLLAWRHRP